MLWVVLVIVLLCWTSRSASASISTQSTALLPHPQIYRRYSSILNCPSEIPNPECSPAQTQCSSACQCINGWVPRKYPLQSQPSNLVSCRPPSCLNIQSLGPATVQTVTFTSTVASYLQWRFQVSSCEPGNVHFGEGTGSLKICDFAVYDVPGVEFDGWVDTAAAKLGLGTAGNETYRSSMALQSLSVSDGTPTGALDMLFSEYSVSKSEALLTLSWESAQPVVFKTLILLDASGSVHQYWTSLQAGVQKLLGVLSNAATDSNSKASYHLALAIFYGSNTFKVIQGMTADLNAVNSALQSAAAVPFATTPLYGAVLSGLDYLEFTRNQTTGVQVYTTLVLFTDGTDQEQPTDAEYQKVINAVRSSRSLVYVIQVQGEDSQKAKNIASKPAFYFPVAQSVDAIGGAFAQVASNLGHAATGVYTLKYCSPRKLSKNVLLLTTSNLHTTSPPIMATYDSSLFVNTDNCFRALTMFPVKRRNLVRRNNNGTNTGGTGSGTASGGIASCVPQAYVQDDSPPIFYLLPGAVAAIVIGAILGTSIFLLGLWMVCRHYTGKRSPAYFCCGCCVTIFGLAIAIAFGVGFYVPSTFWQRG
ncbi:hypothetical protein BJ742DRAFT_794902 [Cladochytrium replicatum]|nr:hypothetical protein BJ742DRAFT_794902 [Cladochytrium replicatum]